jgi:predicted phosphate transport protein (TIGR00153 family)
MRVLFRDFLSNRDLFFDQFDLAAKNAADMATLLVNIVNSGQGEERSVLFKQVDKMEHGGDDIKHKINLALNKIVFTPLNREHIHLLAAAIDEIANMIREASVRINLYNITDFVAPIKELAALLQKAGVEIQKAVKLLKARHSANFIIIACGQVKEYDRQADKIYYSAVANLFSNDKDPINLIKYREILHSLETAVNKCKRAADVLEVILINR